LTRFIPAPKTIGKAREERMFKDLFSLKGRVALVTGGSRGIGKMIAAGFLSQGAAKVYITARKAGPCEATAKELTAEYDGECIALPIDISTIAGCDKLAGEIIKLEPKLDILVNNAGAAWGAEFDEFPESGWDKVMDLNVKSLFFLTKALAKPLRAAATCGASRVSIFTYSKSPGLLSMPTLGGAIQGANLPGSVTGFISEAMKSPSSVDGSHSPLRLFQVASSISTPSGVAWMSLNSPIWRWKATFGSVSLKS
jgi:NAD(P)-dependent dehydrogenase (short-subunit alcohol dehydrogenase family)